MLKLAVLFIQTITFPDVDGWIINKSGNAEFYNIRARGVVTGSVLEGSLIDGSLFVDPETESVVPTEADVGAYPRYLTFVNDYLKTSALSSYSGADKDIDNYNTYTVTSALMTCPIVSANHTESGYSDIFYYNQNRFEKYQPFIILKGVDNTVATSNWCSGPYSYLGDEPRQPAKVTFKVRLITPGQADINLVLLASISSINCGDNDGNAWPAGLSVATAVDQGFTLKFYYQSPGCHGRNASYFTFLLSGRLPFNYFGNGSVTCEFSVEWYYPYYGSANRATTFRGISFGGYTRT